MTEESEIKKEIREAYKDTYPNIIFNLTNRIESLKKEIMEAGTKSAVEPVVMPGRDEVDGKGWRRADEELPLKSCDVWVLYVKPGYSKLSIKDTYFNAELKVFLGMNKSVIYWMYPAPPEA